MVPTHSMDPTSPTNLEITILEVCGRIMWRRPRVADPPRPSDYAPELNPDELVRSHMMDQRGASPTRQRGAIEREGRGPARLDQENTTARPLVVPGTRCRLYWRPLSESAVCTTFVYPGRIMPASIAKIRPNW